MIHEDKRYNRADEIKLINLRTHRAAQHLLNIPVNKDIPLRISCECIRPGCDWLITIPFMELENIRKNHPDAFIVTPSHIDEMQLKVIMTKIAFALVAKSA